MEKDWNAVIHGEGWWNRGAWQQRSVLPLSHNPALLGYANPDCKHDRCSFTVMNCEACREYTNRMALAGLGSDDARGLSGSGNTRPAGVEGSGSAPVVRPDERDTGKGGSK